MYNQSYEEYMRNVLGYSMSYPNMYEIQNERSYNQDTNYLNLELENLYPDIYKIIYPMVRKMCSQNVENITEEKIEQMTNEIYINIESETNTNIQVQSPRTDIKNARTKEVEEPRQRNYLLKDLIRILILRELLAGNRPPNRPPRPMPYNQNWR